MLAFLSFTFVMSFTPGPNTIMAMVSGQRRGFRRSIILNMGMLTGIALIGLLAALFANLLQAAPLLVTIMKVIGSVYLIYLAYHVAISSPDSNDNDGGGKFTTGLLLQLTNIKLYLYFVTGLAAFTLTGLAASIPLRWLLMVIIGSAGTLAWTGAGQLISGIYARYYRIINIAVACLLLFSAYDLWR
ncbi:LysE family transporter [Lacticaseibacillus zhaodongensis]|uniref:LysE family transporter n=1 Tax=Lacticaseibacillus zhaodongensis TaxID=2668065 RepID=UPI0012D33D72|nr:LysE family transporter [Lacticaseibacillus zhaodongensis]